MSVPVARTYDGLNAVLFATSGGSGRLRQRLVDALALTPGSRALELGCGTGQVTARLLATGAHVIAVDALPEMLNGARRRAPAAEYLIGDIFDIEPTGTFDAVVLSFVLHNLGAQRRRQLLAKYIPLLRPDGCVAILDWAQPAGRLRAAAWRSILSRIEPSPSVGQILNGALSEDLVSTGLEVSERRPLAGGRVQLLLARPRPGEQGMTMRFGRDR